MATPEKAMVFADEPEIPLDPSEGDGPVSPGESGSPEGVFSKFK